MKVVLLSSAFPNDFYLSQWCQRIKSRAFSQELVPIQHLAVKLAHYASELDDACSADPPGGIKHAIECRRPNREAAWVNIIASRCETPGSWRYCGGNQGERIILRGAIPDNRRGREGCRGRARRHRRGQAR